VPHTTPDRPARPVELPRLLDITTLATHLGVNARHIRRLVAERRIPYIKWGHLIRSASTPTRSPPGSTTTAASAELVVREPRFQLSVTRLGGLANQARY
jgi:hypothetical protein